MVMENRMRARCGMWYCKDGWRMEWQLRRYGRDLAKASKRVAKNPFFGKFYLMWSKECVKTTTML